MKIEAQFVKKTMLRTIVLIYILCPKYSNIKTYSITQEYEQEYRGTTTVFDHCNIRWEPCGGRGIYGTFTVAEMFSRSKTTTITPLSFSLVSYSGFPPPSLCRRRPPRYYYSTTTFFSSVPPPRMETLTALLKSSFPGRGSRCAWTFREGLADRKRK